VIVSEERNYLNTNHCNHLNLSAYLDVYPVYVYDIELKTTLNANDVREEIVRTHAGRIMN